MSLPSLAELHILMLKASFQAMAGVPNMDSLTPQQVFNVIAKERELLDRLEREAEAELVRTPAERKSANAQAG